MRIGRQATKRGGLGFDIKLTSMSNTPQVFWSTKGNSYVTDGKAIYSINGIGEIRWKVEVWNRDAESDDARAYFGIV